VLLVDAYAGSDIKTWRETQNRPISYSAFKAKGGGVLHDLSHEIDYLSWAFGKLNLVFAKGGRYSNVTHDSEDAWDIICESANVPKISIRLNYLDKSNTRQLRVITDVETHVFDLLNNSISSSTSGEYFGGNKIADTYREMHLAILSGEGSESISTFVQGLEVDTFISACINFNSGANR
jgi:predicted dehydrogenase